MGILKNILKDYLLIFKIRNRFYPSVQIGQRQLYHYYKDCARKGNVPPLVETGFKVFSQFEEDGKLLFLFAVIGMDNKQFIDIGADDGINSNCANLFFNFGWHGLFIDSNKWSIDRGKKFYRRYPNPWQFQPIFVCSKVTPDNINQLIRENGFSGEVGLLSIDIDSYDYWVWNAIAEAEPRVVIIETHNEFGLNNIIVPYKTGDDVPRHPAYHGASPIAMVNLARKKGYRLVGANELGVNFIFVKNGIAEDLIPEVDVASVLTHPSVAEGAKVFEEIKDWEYIKG